MNFVRTSVDDPGSPAFFWIRRAAAGAALVLAIGALSGCNTTEGAGEDIEDLGESIQEAAD